MIPPRSDPGFTPAGTLAAGRSSGDVEAMLLDGSPIDLLNSYAPIFLAAFLVTLFITPLIRRIAVAADVVDHPDLTRKTHAYPVAYLGGVAVFLGLFAAIAVSYLCFDGYTAWYPTVPLAVVAGMVAITFTGLGDDVWAWDPRLKIAGQLIAAAGLAISDVGVHVAEGLLRPLVLGIWGEAGPDVTLVSLGEFDLLSGHLYYWAGTALIAVFVLGGCNAANFIDGLDGLLTGVIGVVAIGLLVICLLMTPVDNEAQATAKEMAERLQPVAEARQAEIDNLLPPRFRIQGGDWVRDGELTEAGVDMLVERLPHVELADLASDRSWANALEIAVVAPIEELLYRTIAENVDLAVPQGWKFVYDAESGQVVAVGRMLTGARIVLCLALLGAVLGFLPHNFNPASIFLGDCGSLLLGYICVVIILMLGDRGQTHLVLAGLIVFAIPIMDTMLAIIRRRLAGVPVSVGDDMHIHHQLLRALGGVKRAVFALYGISALFALLGVAMAGLVLHELLRVRFIYAIAIVLFSFIAVIAVKAARRHQRAVAADAPTAKPLKAEAKVAADGEKSETAASRSSKRSA